MGKCGPWLPVLLPTKAKRQFVLAWRTQSWTLGSNAGSRFQLSLAASSKRRYDAYCHRFALIAHASGVSGKILTRRIPSCICFISRSAFRLQPRYHCHVIDLCVCGTAVLYMVILARQLSLVLKARLRQMESTSTRLRHTSQPRLGGLQQTVRR